MTVCNRPNLMCSLCGDMLEVRGFGYTDPLVHRVIHHPGRVNCPNTGEVITRLDLQIVTLQNTHDERGDPL